MMILVEGMFSFFACLFFAIIYNTPKKELFLCGLNGGIGYAICYDFTANQNAPLWGAFWGTFFICIFARFFSKRRHMPVILYILPPIFPIVPGADIYYAIYNIMVNDLFGAISAGVDTFKTVGVIIAAMVIALSLPNSIFEKTTT